MQPLSIKKASGWPVRFDAAASGVPAPAVLWQVKALGSTEWTDIGGANGTPYTFSASLADTGSQYRAVFTNVIGTATTSPAALTVVPPSVSGDIDGDGRADLIWRNLAGGANAVWNLAGTRKAGISQLPIEPDLAWRLVGIGDFDGDGRADLLWHDIATGANRVWLMQGTTHVETRALEDESDLNWTPVGIGDFNRDGIPDLLWRNTATGANRVWYFDDALTRTGTAALDPVADQHWTIVGTGDFNGDGKVDLAWRHGVTGANAVMYFDWATKIGTGELPAETDLTWTIIGVGDFNQDGHPDLVWRNVVTGATRLSYLAGLARTGTAALDPIAAMVWTAPGSGLSAPAEPMGLTASSTGPSISLSWAAPVFSGSPTAYVIDAGSGQECRTWPVSRRARQPRPSLHPGSRMDSIGCASGRSTARAAAGRPTKYGSSLDRRRPRRQVCRVG